MSATRPLKLLMMGTGPFAVPTFCALLKSRHRVLALVTRPDKPQHRHGKAPQNPMREVAVEHRIEVFAPSNINSPEAHAWLGERNVDLLVVCDYGQILSNQSLGMAVLGGINLHASLLPKYRGAAPINWAIYHGETETGITVIHMTPELDAGPALVQKRTFIAQDETAPDLESRLSEIGARAVLEAIDMIAENRQGSAISQDPKLVTTARRLKKDDGLVDWSRSAAQIANQVRAMQTWPKTYTLWHRDSGEPVRLILEVARPVAANPSVNHAEVTPGTVVEATGDMLRIGTGGGILQIDAIQPAGKRVLRTAEFLRGYSLALGTRLG